MRLAPRLVLAFGGLTALSTAGLGLTLREELRRDGSDRFGRDVAAACESVKTEVARQAESDRKLVAAACQSGELVDRVITWTESGELANQLSTHPGPAASHDGNTTLESLHGDTPFPTARTLREPGPMWSGR